MNTPTEIIYLQISPRELAVEDAIKNFNVYFETIDEYIERIKSQNKSVLGQNDIEYHIRQLLDIMVDTELVFEWLKIKYAPDSVKANFLLGINSKEQLDHLVSYKKRNFCNDKKLDELINRNYQEALDELYTQIKEMQAFFDEKHNKKVSLRINYTEGSLASLLNIGISCNLGLRILPEYLAQNYLYPMMSKQFGMIYSYNYISAPILQYNKEKDKVIEFEDNTIFFSNIARNSYNGIVSIWDALHPYEDNTIVQEAPLNYSSNRTKDYSLLSLQEKIEAVYENYPLLDKNFFKIICNHNYCDSTLIKGKDCNEDFLVKENQSNSYDIKDGYATLIITYIHSKVGTANGSWSLLASLFNKDEKSIRTTSKRNNERYFENHIVPFEKFINKYKDA